MASPPGLGPYLVVQVALGLVIAAALGYVARLTIRVHETSQYPRPIRMFAAWWGALGGAWVTWSVDTAIVASGATGRAAASLDYALIVVYFALVLMAFGSLFYYLLFLYVGSDRLSSAVWWIYGAVTLGLTALLLVANPPASFEVSGLYASSLFAAYTPFADALRIALLLPVLVAALALVWVSRRLAPGIQRYRARLISASLAFYLLMPLFFGSNPGDQPDTAFEWAREARNKAGLLVALGAAILAYRPPRAVAERLTLREDVA